jgi:hypothetical protein
MENDEMIVKRVQMDLPEQSFERLKDLKKKIEASTYTEVMKEALRLYEFILDTTSGGAKLLIQRTGEPPAEIKIF